ncbi:hypothetical protein DFP73DRAFT_529859 [Morchella snyderi]|nr:hypothetical protein DFP73DRAFT_529859 [Morchella snyderi]
MSTHSTNRPHPVCDSSIFDPAAATALFTDFHRFIISLPVLRNLLTNPGSEKIVWTPCLEVRMAKIAAFRRSCEVITKAYRKKSNKTTEDEEFVAAVWDRYTDCLEGLSEVVNAHKESQPVNEALAAEAEELRAGKRERLFGAMEWSGLTIDQLDDGCQSNNDVRKAYFNAIDG